jgi:hypothetical protein
MNTDLANLRRARSRCHFRLKQAEDLAQSYRDKLADLEARIRAIAPELELPVRFRRANPVFARTELTRLALAILREADEPLPIRVVAVRALKAKGIAWPDPALRRRTRTKLREAFGKLRARGVLVAVGRGNATRHRLASSRPSGVAGHRKYTQEEQQLSAKIGLTE